jgi:hypothetical protein
MSGRALMDLSSLLIFQSEPRRQSHLACFRTDECHWKKIASSANAMYPPAKASQSGDFRQEATENPD